VKVVKNERPIEDYISYLGHNADGTVRLKIDLAMFIVFGQEAALAAIDAAALKYLKEGGHVTGK
jgi:hypothetical protein